MVYILTGSMIFASLVQGKEISRTWVQQKKSNWCWAACAENSVLAQMTLSKHQDDAVHYLKGTTYGSEEVQYPNG